MTWEIFVGLGVLLSFIISVATPMLKLNSSIVKLNDNLDYMHKEIETIKANSTKSHERIWRHNSDQDEKIEKLDEKVDNHENRLTIIETKMEK